MVALALDAGTRHAVVVLVPPDSPGDLHLIDLADSAKQQLTSYNQLYFQEHPPAKLQKFSVKRGSWQIESRAWLPPDFSESKRYPMVLEDTRGTPACLVRRVQPGSSDTRDGGIHSPGGQSPGVNHLWGGLRYGGASETGGDKITWTTWRRWTR